MNGISNNLTNSLNDDFKLNFDLNKMNSGSNLNFKGSLLENLNKDREKNIVINQNQNKQSLFKSLNSNLNNKKSLFNNNNLNFVSNNKNLTNIQPKGYFFLGNQNHQVNQNQFNGNNQHQQTQKLRGTSH